MAKFLCVCGEQIRTSGDIPNPQESLLFSAAQLIELPDPAPYETMYTAGTLLYRCPRSGHLFIFWDDIDGPPQMYQPVDGHGRGGPSHGDSP